MAAGHCKFCDRPSVGRGMCYSHYRRYQEGKRGADLNAPIRDYHIGDIDLQDNSGPPVPGLEYDQEWRKFCKWIGAQKNRRPKLKPKPKGEIIHGVIADPHIPFHDQESILEAVDWFVKENVSVVHIAGDVADHYSLSRFAQYVSVPIQHEAIETRKIIDLISRTFSEVFIMGGNHEGREKKYMAARLPADLLIYYLAEGFMARTCHDMTNVNLIKRTVEDTPMYWIAPVGQDVIIAHAETQSKITLRAAENVRAWMDNWHNVIGVGRPRIIMQAHTHNAGIARVGNQVVIELGCTCRLQGYALEPKLYGKPQVQAATVFKQVDGVTDINSIRQRYLRQN